MESIFNLKYQSEFEEFFYSIKHDETIMNKRNEIIRTIKRNILFRGENRIFS